MFTITLLRYGFIQNSCKKIFLSFSHMQCIRIQLYIISFKYRRFWASRLSLPLKIRHDKDALLFQKWNMSHFLKSHMSQTAALMHIKCLHNSFTLIRDQLWKIAGKRKIYFWNWEDESHAKFVMILTEEQLRTVQIAVYKILLLKGLMYKSWKYEKYSFLDFAVKLPLKFLLV